MDITEFLNELEMIVGRLSEEQRKEIAGKLTNWEVFEYAWFTNVEDLIADHKELKKQIKDWENWVDNIDERLSFSDVSVEKHNSLYDEDMKDDIRNDLQEISYEMMSVNM